MYHHQLGPAERPSDAVDRGVARQSTGPDSARQGIPECADKPERDVAVEALAQDDVDRRLLEERERPYVPKSRRILTRREGELELRR